MKKITIVIADDHPFFRSGVRTELEDIDNFEIVGETGDGKEAFSLIQKLNPDVAILDFQMPGMTGLEITSELNSINSSTQVVLLTMYRDKRIFFTALDAGAKGYVLKEDAIADIVKAVNNVAAGDYFISENLTPLLVEKAQNNFAGDSNASLIKHLTPAERNILSLIADLKTNDEIADMLCISRRTVENHKSNMADKLQLRGARDLIKFALENKEYFKY
ncbi:MAG: response regulator transcription factor [Ignavibacteria bacterium]|jgi:DNA-binding NarL/FixJ family response regulator